MSLKTIPIRNGPQVFICALATQATDGGKDPCPTLDFFKTVAAQQPEETAKMAKLLQHIACDGPPANEEKFKHLPGTESLYEIKTTRLRVLCFWDDNRLIVCTHGFVKKTNKTPKRELNRAEQKRADYFRAKKSGVLNHEQAHQNALRVL